MAPTSGSQSVHRPERSDEDDPPEVESSGTNVARGDNAMDVDLVEDIPIFLLSQLGADTRAYSRERRSSYRTLVGEVFSPPRVNGYLGRFPNQHLGPGFALDITIKDESGNPWGFTVETQKRKALELVVETQPDLVVGSPMCKRFCSWQHLNAVKLGWDPAMVRREQLRAEVHLRFVCQLY